MSLGVQSESLASWGGREVSDQLAAARSAAAGGPAGGDFELSASENVEERLDSNAMGPAAAAGRRYLGRGQALEGPRLGSSNVGFGQALDERARSSSMSSGRVRALRMLYLAQYCSPPFGACAWG